ncbi:hypothetical protein [Duganella sp. HH105]|uniref:hypothetical protein n=1 Tax=Duganella sp. HH105 TaxID=1781067 RepID=UPI000892D5E4|nr:hypothetical protein [Duganella sp. HH105]OEZ54894.1 hypothetical protein DUGA6_56650 [Duganella sp. HH105]
MSRLLPESIKIGLFAGGCWMKRGRAAPIVMQPEKGESLDASMSAAFASLLAQLSDGGVGRARLHVVVSDSLAAISMLPWQEALADEDELRAYAHVCFERDGCMIDDSWAMQVGFRHFRASGMAYALPRLWLEKLQALCDTAGFRLKTVLPVSAAAYWRLASARGAVCSLVLLEEASRLTAMVYERGRLIARDVQPVMADIDVAGMRLLRRVSASHRPVDAVQTWPASASGPQQGFVHTCWPDVRVTPLLAEVWS